MKHESTGYIMNGIGAIFSAVQPNEIFSYISWALTIIATIVSLIYTFWKWYRKAKEDGKIDDEEIEEAIDIAKVGIDELGDTMKGEKGHAEK